MPLEALVLQLHLLEVLLLWRNILAEAVMLVELLEGGDAGLALRGVVGAEEVELDVGDALDQEGRTALVGASVHFLPDIRYAFHAEYLGTRSLATHRLDAHLIADPALVLLPEFLRFQEVGSG